MLDGGWVERDRPWFHEATRQTVAARVAPVRGTSAATIHRHSPGRSAEPTRRAPHESIRREMGRTATSLKEER